VEVRPLWERVKQRQRETWKKIKESQGDLKRYLRGTFIERGHTYRPSPSWYGEEKYFGKDYRARRKRKNREAYLSRKINSFKRRNKS